MAGTSNKGRANDGTVNVTPTETLQQMLKEQYPGLDSKSIVSASHGAADEIMRILDQEVRAARKRSSESRSNSDLHLLALPAEIRNWIWELCVVHFERRSFQGSFGLKKATQVPIFIETILVDTPPGNVDYTPRPPHDSKDAIQPAITRVCRQTRNEAMQLFYSMNEFELEVLPWYAASTPYEDRAVYCMASRWINAIGAKNAKHLKKLTKLPHDPGNGEMDVRAAIQWFRDAGVTHDLLDVLKKEMILADEKIR